MPGVIMALSDQERRQAARARELIEAAGGLEACAAETGISTSHLQRYSSKSEKDSMPVRVIEALEAVTEGLCGHPIMTRHLATQAGYNLVPVPEFEPTEREWNSHVARLTSASAALIAGIAESLALHHDLSPAQATWLAPAARELSVITAEIEAALQARARAGGAQ